MKIVIFGLGHVGSAYEAYLKDRHELFVVDPKLGKSLEKNDYDLALICVDTPFDEQKNCLDTSKVDDCVNALLAISDDIDIVIKSTLPIGYTNKLISTTKYNRIFVSPEFLREKHALEDIKNPSRIVVGTLDKNLPGVNKYLSLFNSQNIVVTGINEAEAIKLFSNSYLAMRLSFVNEIDTLGDKLNFNSFEVIKGMSYDPRIGDTYNVVSDGWGGSCLPKDSKELAKEASENGQTFFNIINESNEQRKEYKNKK